MIESFGSLLDELRRKESEALAKYSIIQHPTLIGNMYEGLTKELLRRSLFRDISLHVVDGKIRGMRGNLSDQMDCIITTAPGEHIPYTTSRIVGINDVVAVIEVKKTLHTADLSDAFDNIGSVPPSQPDPTTRLRSAASAFRLIAQQDACIRNLRLLDRDMQMLFSCLADNSLKPLRIILGYFGFTKESRLRQAIVDVLQSRAQSGEEITGRSGIGPSGLPNLILCGEHAVLKCDALPYYSPLCHDFPYPPDGMSAENWWFVYGSTTGRNGRLLLELLWTRLRQRFEIPADIFGEDLAEEKFRPLIAAKPFAGKGWAYTVVPLPASKCEIPPIDDDWQPIYLNEAQFTIVQMLCIHDEISIADNAVCEFLRSRGTEPIRFFRELSATGLVCVNGFQKLVFLTEHCQTAVLPDGQYVAGEDVSGRFSRWLNLYMERRLEARNTSFSSAPET